MTVSVFAEVLPPGLSRAMHRINAELRRAAPAEVTFVESPEKADLQILDVIGKGSIEYLVRDAYVILQHCYLTTETTDPDFWLPIFRRARLVMSYHDLYGLTNARNFQFYRAPWGVDGTVFHDRKLPRTYAVLTSGCDPHGEAIRECYEGALRAQQPIVHLGPGFQWGEGFVSVQGVSDGELADWYSRCRYVSGLRRGEGFELPVLEGLACGCRPICFDTEGYRHWFGEHALYVPEVSSPELTENLRSIFMREPKPVTLAEREQVIRKFDWASNLKEFWDRALA